MKHDYKTPPSEKEQREKVRAMIKDVRMALMVTQDETGFMSARPMAAAKTDGTADLWFFTALDSEKVQNIEQNNQVLLSYSEPSDQNYVSLTGRAEIIRDRDIIRAHWSEMARIWFPEGVDDPNLGMIRVHPESAEYWDAPAKSFVYAYGYVRQRLTGKAPNTGEHGKVNMH